MKKTTFLLTILVCLAMGSAAMAEDRDRPGAEASLDLSALDAMTPAKVKALLKGLDGWKIASENNNDSGSTKTTSFGIIKGLGNIVTVTFQETETAQIAGLVANQFRKQEGSAVAQKGKRLIWVMSVANDQALAQEIMRRILGSSEKLSGKGTVSIKTMTPKTLKARLGILTGWQVVSENKNESGGTKTTSFGIVDGSGASNIVTVTFQVTQSEEIAKLVLKELVKQEGSALAQEGEKLVWVLSAIKKDKKQAQKILDQLLGR